MNEKPRVVRCHSCGGKCRWSDDAWVCTKCGDEWYADHDAVEYRAPDEDAPIDLKAGESTSASSGQS